MTIAIQTILLRISLVTMVVVLAACGGGSSDKPATSASSNVTSNAVSSSISAPVSSIGATSSSSSIADTTPDAFSFIPVVGAALSTPVTSGTITLSGFDVAVPVTIVNGEYSINGGAFTSAAGTISPAQTLAVKVLSSGTNSTAVDATLTVGGVSGTYRVTTLADAIPDAFTFAPAVNVAPASINTSNTVTLAGFEVAVPITITGGEYSINGGDFTSAAGTVTNGQTIAVKVLAPAGTELTNQAAVSIGGVTGNYSVTTLPDITAPVAEFKFPTPYTMSEATTVKVRGTATDEHTITSVKVVVNDTTEIEVTPKSVTGGAPDFSSWTAEVPLTEGAENEIKVVATDNRDNVTVTDAANKVVIRQRVDYSGVFPDSGSVIGSTRSLILDQSKNRLFYASSLDEYKLFEIDIATGKSEVFADFTQQDLRSFGNGAVDANFEYAYIPTFDNQTILKLNINDATDFSLHHNNEYGDSRAAVFTNDDNVPKLISLRRDINSNGGVVVTQLDTWGVSVLSDVSLGIPNTDVPFSDGNTIVYDQKNHRYLVASPGVDALLAIDASTGVRSIFSSELVGSGDAYAEGENGLISKVALDKERNRAIVLEIFSGNIFAVDLDTAARSIISQMTLLHPTSQIWPDNEKNYIGAQIDTEKELLYTVHHRVQALMVVDLQSGQQLILSKAENPAQ